MSIIDWFNKHKKTNEKTKKLNIPDDLWIKCFACRDVLFLKDLTKNKKVCLKCNYHFRLSPEERINYIFDKNSFVEMDSHIGPIDFLKFKDTQNYQTRIDAAQKKTKHKDAIVTGTARLNKYPVNIGVMNFSFMGGSMGSVVGEKITRLIENARQTKNPVILFTASGGARMQEGTTSLMQMAKTSAALQQLETEKIPYISVLCDPTTGGTSASFAMLGDVNIAEPNALISFAGPRVIEQTIRQKLPEGFQRSEFLLEHGILDMVVHRKDLRMQLTHLIKLLNPHTTPEPKETP